jgi:hypothetical protein
MGRRRGSIELPSIKDNWNFPLTSAQRLPSARVHEHTHTRVCTRLMFAPEVESIMLIYISGRFERNRVCIQLGFTVRVRSFCTPLDDTNEHVCLYKYNITHPSPVGSQQHCRARGGLILSNDCYTSPLNAPIRPWGVWQSVVIHPRKYDFYASCPLVLRTHLVVTVLIFSTDSVFQIVLASHAHFFVNVNLQE